MPLPTFLLIGAAKSGTTSLYRYLGQHPDIFVSPVKEPNFFAFEGSPPSFQGPQDERCNRLSVTSLSAYKGLFETDAPARGEASPSSLYYPKPPERIAHYVPDARILAILRDPVERAYSNFLHMVKEGREPYRDFGTALNREADRLDSGWSYFWAYTHLGFYHEQLLRYYDRFPADQIHVCLLSDLAERPTATLRTIFRFLGVNDTVEPDTTTQHNPSGMPRIPALHWLLHHAGLRPTLRSWLPAPVRRVVSTYTSDLADRLRRWKLWVMRRNLARPPMDDDVRRRLCNLYHDDVRRLQSLIDRDLSHWLNASPSS